MRRSLGTRVEPTRVAATKAVNGRDLWALAHPREAPEKEHQAAEGTLYEAPSLRPGL